MANKKYLFNQDSLQFEKIELSIRQKLLKSLPFVVITLLFGIVFFYLSDKYIEFPRVKDLIASRNEIITELDYMKANLDLMDEKLSDIQYNDDKIYRTYFEVDPLPPSLRVAGFGGNDNYDIFSDSKYYGLLSDIGRSLDMMEKKLVVQSRSFDRIIEMAKTKEKRLAAKPAIQPISIKELTRFGSSFGMRVHPILQKMKMHEGIDLTAPRGTKIFATADGVVLQAGYTDGGYGNKIIIDHGFGYRTLYGHCYKINVKPGQKVKRGDVIGLVGSTGLSTCPHLHYEVHVNGKKVNPINYYANDLSGEEYDKMIELLSKADPSFDIN
jgi:murein DD-endopeptidase MepM/ murein hydrolase activator NlpD